jgi:putative two-component system response regulator
MDGLDQSRTVLVVDDEEQIRNLLHRLLTRSGYECEVAGNVEAARALLKERSFALCLTDMTMPGESGLDLVMHLAEEYPDTAAVMVTGVDDTKLTESALEVGAYGYIVKPFTTNEMLINLSNALRRRSLEIEHREHRSALEGKVKERTSELWNAIAKLEAVEQELKSSREETVSRLSRAAEFKDHEMANHIGRMSRYCGLIAGRAGMDMEQVELIRVASVMHDVGKIGIPDRILLKPGQLKEDERLIMQEHAQMGYDILSGSDSALLQYAASIALTHHEKYDGTGYPNQMKGEEIPIEGRIAAISDVFDALTSNRVYKRAFPIGKALDILREDSEKHFDPLLLEAFLGAMDKVLDIQAEINET